VLFYLATHDRLEPFKPFGKFLTIKSIIFFSFWLVYLKFFEKMISFNRQSTLILFLMKIGAFGDPKNISTQQIASSYQDFIICIEMVLAALAYSFTFSYTDFLDITKSPRPILNNLKTV